MERPSSVRTGGPRWPRLNRAAYPLAIAILSAVKVWLDGGLRVLAMPGQSFDDGLYGRLAEAILRGEWLGPFDALTLSKNPLFPMWIATVHRLGFPMLQAQSVLYVAAGVLLVNELVARGLARPSAVTLFAIYAFNPFVEVRVLREGIYGSLLVATIALGARVARRMRDARFDALASGLLGAAVAATWLTREEGVLLLVPLGVLLAPVAFSAARRRPTASCLRSAAASLATTCAAAGACLGLVALANLRVYGVFRTNDQTSPPFASAVGALLSVEHAHPVPYLTVPREVRVRLYRESPAFGTLLPFIDGSDGSREQRQGWRQLSCALYESSCGDFAGAWFTWALRQAVADAGHYRSAGTADAFYARLTAEVDAACAQGRLRCTPRRASVIPPLRGYGWSEVAQFAVLGTQVVLAFPLRDYVFGEGSRSECDAQGCRQVEWLTGNTVAPPRLDPLSIRQPVRSEQTRRSIGKRLGAWYAALFGPAFVLGMVLYVVRLLEGLIRRRPSGFGDVELALLAAIGSRIAMLAYVEATMFPAFGNWSAYITPLYPLMLVLAGLSLIEALSGVSRHMRALRARRAAGA